VETVEKNRDEEKERMTHLREFLQPPLEWYARVRLGRERMFTAEWIVGVVRTRARAR
jgi:hypothetical protein